MVPADSLPAIRDRYLGPSLLSPFADDMARRLSRLSVGPLLETAADTGLLTQAIASSVSAGLTIIATDPSTSMVDYASDKPGTARVIWQTAEPCALPFEAGTFGIVACQFGVMALTDRVQGFREARRVMKQGARFVFNVPATFRHNPVADCVQRAMGTLFPSDTPRYLSHVLHGYADNEVVDDELTVAGFTDAIYTTVDLPYAAAAARDAAVGYCLGTPLRAEIDARAGGDTDPVVASVTAALRRRFGAGPIASTMRAHVVSAAG
ncbi:class I SAM-dependent methyltransferase [Rhodopila sp.]|uniref:class I SAM-dependent methyltransferase n=1 Tax=Rhodopila sp. TaxID=2480087 RepID=UPI003D1046D3